MRNRDIKTLLELTRQLKPLEDKLLKALSDIAVSVTIGAPNDNILEVRYRTRTMIFSRPLEFPYDYFQDNDDDLIKYFVEEIKHDYNYYTAETAKRVSAHEYEDYLRLKEKYDKVDQKSDL